MNEKAQQGNFVILIILFFIQAVDSFFREGIENNLVINILDNLKNVYILLFIIWCIIQLLYLKNKKIYIFRFELQKVIFLFLILIIIALYYIVKNNTSNYYSISYSISRILIPVILSFLLLNVMNFNKLYKAMIYFLVFCFFFFILEKLVQGRFNLDNIIQAFNFSIANSTGSQLESNYFSPLAIGFCFFFGYYRKDKVTLLISVLFAILTYKRIITIFALIILIFGHLIVKMKIFGWIKYIVGVVFFIVVIYYINWNLGYTDTSFIYNNLGISLEKFTMGRTQLFQNAYLLNIPKSGIFSYLPVLHSLGFRAIEMDFPEFYLESGYISIIFIIYFLLKLSKKSMYLLLLMLFTLLEMLTSHWFDQFFFWIIIYILIGGVNYNLGEEYCESNTIVSDLL